MKKAMRWMDERGWGWRQVAVQILFVITVIAFVLWMLLLTEHEM